MSRNSAACSPIDPVSRIVWRRPRSRSAFQVVPSSWNSRSSQAQELVVRSDAVVEREQRREEWCYRLCGVDVRLDLEADGGVLQRAVPAVHVVIECRRGEAPRDLRPQELLLGEHLRDATIELV